MREFYSIYRSVLSDFDHTFYLERLARNEVHRGTKDEHIGLIEGVGFTITKVISDTMTLRFLDGSTLLRHPLIQLGFLEGWRNVVTKTHEEAVFTSLEARLNAAAARQGELRMTVPMLYIEAEK
jgi:hypothetical protein